MSETDAANTDGAVDPVSPSPVATPPRRGYPGRTGEHHLFLWRSSFNCFLRLCLAIFFRRFFFRLPIFSLKFELFQCSKTILHLTYHRFGQKATGNGVFFGKNPKKSVSDGTGAAGHSPATRQLYPRSSSSALRRSVTRQSICSGAKTRNAPLCPIFLLSHSSTRLEAQAMSA